MESKDPNNDVLDENKRDFELLKARSRRGSSSASSASTKSSDRRPRSEPASPSSPVFDPGANEMIWPLHLTPTFVDHYVIGEVIGHGSYAEVRECVDTKTLERFAMKIINKEYLTRQAPRALDNQLQEIRFLRHFNHANIISMKECLSKGNNVYIILEYCSFNLDELLKDQKDGKFHVSIGRRFFHQLCVAVNYLHSLGIVHRDIKPQNLLLSNCGNLKLIDFGVSHMLSMWDRNDRCANYEGSPLFQAPEIVAAEREYSGFKADVWACGVTLFLMLYGQYPFMDDSLLGLYDKILAQELVVPEQPATTSSSALTDLLVWMLEKASSKRAHIEQVLQHPWMKLLGAANECDELEYSEFFDLVIKRHNDKEKWFQIHATSQHKDMYKSMTVLPYLYRHHFPNLPIRKPRPRSGSEASDSNVVITRINPLSPPAADDRSRSPQRDAKVSRGAAGASESATDSSANVSEQSESGYDNEQIEWGTKIQYHLMKLPQIRANRIRCGASTKFKNRRKDKKTGHRKED
jgi:serine/threonine protein kinase